MDCRGICQHWRKFNWLVYWLCYWRLYLFERNQVTAGSWQHWVVDYGIQTELSNYIKTEHLSIQTNVAAAGALINDSLSISQSVAILLNTVGMERLMNC